MKPENCHPMIAPLLKSSEQKTGVSDDAGRAKGCWFWAGWEPDRYYKRIGARGTRYFGNGDWIAEWRARLESPSSLEQLKQVGGTVLITRFYKGLSPAVEGKDWASLKRFVELAHENDLKVWGYLQGQSLFGEFLFNEHPEAKDWIARSYDGSPRLWGGAYNRFAPCLSNGEYRIMMESLVVAGLSEVGLDGFHLDNNYYGHCYCDRCKRLFREWLNERGDLEERTGIERADHVQPPLLNVQSDMIPDPLAILWIEFGVQQRLAFMVAIRRKMQETRPGATLTGNPAFMRNFASRLTHGYDPALEHVAFDSVCIENGNRPRFADGILFSQADKHLLAEACSLRTWVTSWAPSSKSETAGYQPPLNSQSLWAGLAEEFSFQGAYLGNTWALRPHGDADTLLLDAHSSQWKEFRKALSYFQNLENELGGEARRQWGEIVVYMDTRNLSLCPASDCLVLQAVMARMVIKCIPFKMVLQGQPIPPETHTVLIAGQRCLADAEMKRLTAWAGSGDFRLWLLGDCGLYDEWFVPRGFGRRRQSIDQKHVRLIPLAFSQWLRGETSSKQYFRGQCPSFSAEGQLAVDGVFAELADNQQIFISGPEGVLANVEVGDERQLMIHVRDLRENRSQVEDREIQVIVRHRLASVTGFSPAWEREGNFFSVPEKDAVTIDLPGFRHYACLYLTRAELSSWGNSNLPPTIQAQSGGQKPHTSKSDEGYQDMRDPVSC